MQKCNFLSIFAMWPKQFTSIDLHLSKLFSIVGKDVILIFGSDHYILNPMFAREFTSQIYLFVVNAVIKRYDFDFPVEILFLILLEKAQLLIRKQRSEQFLLAGYWILFIVDDRNVVVKLLFFLLLEYSKVGHLLCKILVFNDEGTLTKRDQFSCDLKILEKSHLTDEYIAYQHFLIWDVFDKINELHIFGDDSTCICLDPLAVNNSFRLFEHIFKKYFWVGGGMRRYNHKWAILSNGKDSFLIKEVTEKQRRWIFGREDYSVTLYDIVHILFVIVINRYQSTHYGLGFLRWPKSAHNLFDFHPPLHLD